MHIDEHKPIPNKCGHKRTSNYEPIKIVPLLISLWKIYLNDITCILMHNSFLSVFNSVMHHIKEFGMGSNDQFIHKHGHAEKYDAWVLNKIT